MALDPRQLRAFLAVVETGSLGMASEVLHVTQPALSRMMHRLETQLGVPLSTETITHLEFIIFGSLICYLLIKEPHGFARLISIGKEKLRLWPFPY